MTIRPHPTKPDTFVLDPEFFADPTSGLPDDLPVDPTRTLTGWVTDDENMTVTLIYEEVER